MQTRNAFLSLVVLALMGGSVAACTSPGDTTDPKQPHSEVTASKESSTKDTTDEQTEDSDTLTVALDGTATWRNHVTAKLSKFTRGVSGQYASPENTPFLGFTVTVKNGTHKPLDLSMFSLSCPNSADEIFDSENGLDGAPQSHVLPGKSSSWKTACVFKKSETKVQVELTPYDDGPTGYRTAIFTGEAK